MVEIEVIKPPHWGVLHPLNVPDRYEVGETYKLVLNGTVIRTMVCIHCSNKQGFDKCIECPNSMDIDVAICESCAAYPITFIDADELLEEL